MDGSGNEEAGYGKGAYMLQLPFILQHYAFEKCTVYWQDLRARERVSEGGKAGKAWEVN